MKILLGDISCLVSSGANETLAGPGRPRAALPDTRIPTELDVELLRWRCGFGPLHYRRVRGHGGIGLFRLRSRWPATERVVGHLPAPDEASRKASGLEGPPATSQGPMPAQPLDEHLR